MASTIRRGSRSRRRSGSRTRRAACARTVPTSCSCGAVTAACSAHWTRSPARGVEVAILPAGTANLFATNLGIPADLEQAVRIGLHGARRTIDLGRANGEHFGVMAGAGLDAFMIRDAEAGGLKDRIGSLAYVFSGAKNLDRDPVRMRIEVDGDTWFDDRASCVLIGNVGDVVGGISAFPDARPDDGVLDIGVITAESGLDWLRTLSRSVVSDPTRSPFVQTTTGASFDIRTESRAAVRDRRQRARHDEAHQDQGEAQGDHRLCAGNGDRHEHRERGSGDLATDGRRREGHAGARGTVGADARCVHAAAMGGRVQPRALDGLRDDADLRPRA